MNNDLRQGKSEQEFRKRKMDDILKRCPTGGMMKLIDKKILELGQILGEAKANMEQAYAEVEASNKENKQLQDRIKKLEEALKLINKNCSECCELCIGHKEVIKKALKEEGE